MDSDQRLCAGGKVEFGFRLPGTLRILRFGDSGFRVA